MGFRTWHVAGHLICLVVAIWFFPHFSSRNEYVHCLVMVTCICYHVITFNTLRPIQNGRHFADDVLKCIFLNENVWISLDISLKFVPKGPINNIPSLVQIMTCCRPGDKPLSEPTMASLMTHICVTQPQWIHHLLRRGLHHLSGNMGDGPWITRLT